MFSRRRGPGERSGSRSADDPAARHVGKTLGRARTALAPANRRAVSTGRNRLRQVRFGLILAVQAGLAAGLAWQIAHDLLHNPQPVFAPAAAVGTIVSSIGRRLRRSIELIIGVAVGVAIGDFLIVLLGTGALQLGIVVVLAVIVALVLGGRGTLVAQAAGTAVLIATLSPAVGKLEYPRFIDAAVGGSVGMVVVILLLPLNPLRAVERAAGPAAELLADQLDAAADALTRRDAAAAEQALSTLRNISGDFDQVREALSGAQEVVSLAPTRWHRRQVVAAYSQGVDHMDRAALNSKGLIRRVVTVIEDGEPVPATLNSALCRLATAVRLFRVGFAGGRVPEDARRNALLAVTDAARAYNQGVGFSGTVVVAQVRTVTSDLLQASGFNQARANELVHRVAAREADFGQPE